MASKPCLPDCACSKHSAEVRAKQSAWSKARRHSPETRAKISASHKARAAERSIAYRGAGNPHWKGDGAAPHHRVKRERGSARNYTCVDCGGQAAEWSYQGGAPDEFPGRYGPESNDLSFYVPRCVPCHRRYDSPLHPRRVA